MFPPYRFYVVERFVLRRENEKTSGHVVRPLVLDAILGSGGPGLINFFDTLCAAAIYSLHLSEGMELLKG
jgi:hypothetical protein